LSGIPNKSFGIVQLIAAINNAHNLLVRRRCVERGQKRRKVIMEKRPIGLTAQAVALIVIENTASMVKYRVGRVA
jgi:hypothetical protein